MGGGHLAASRGFAALRASRRFPFASMAPKLGRTPRPHSLSPAYPPWRSLRPCSRPPFSRMVCSESPARHGGCRGEAAAHADDDELPGEPARREEQRLRRFREIYDELARGELISLNDLKFALQNAVGDAKVTDEQLDRMMRIADLDNSGSVDFEEFIILFEDIADEDINLRTLAQNWLGFSSSGQDPALIFHLAWRRIVSAAGGEQQLSLPREILFLGGAPGAGKGTMTPFIMHERGLDAKPIVISSLLNSPAAKKIINDGGLVGDLEVFSMLLEELVAPEQRPGALVDGFPRTVVQVKLLQILHDKMSELSRTYDGTEFAFRFPRPRFRMCILYVDEHESIQRQLSRGKHAVEHNRIVEQKGEGKLIEVRETDLSVKAAKARYSLFAESTMAANEALKQLFPYDLINASGSIESVKNGVMQQLAYQSSLELQEDTYNTIKHIPTAADITRHARQHLVSRLDTYQKDFRDTFHAVVKVIEEEFLPAVRRHALIGEARVITRNPEVFSEPLAMDMAVDIMFDRGFALRVEDNTILNQRSFHFKITFRAPELHNVAGGSQIGSSMFSN